MNRNLYLRKIRNLRDQVDMLLQESTSDATSRLYDVNSAIKQGANIFGKTAGQSASDFVGPMFLGVFNNFFKTDFVAKSPELQNFVKMLNRSAEKGLTNASQTILAFAGKTEEDMIKDAREAGRKAGAATGFSGDLEDYGNVNKMTDKQKVMMWKGMDIYYDAFHAASNQSQMNDLLTGMGEIAKTYNDITVEACQKAYQEGYQDGEAGTMSSSTYKVPAVQQAYEAGYVSGRASVLQTTAKAGGDTTGKTAGDEGFFTKMVSSFKTMYNKVLDYWHKFSTSGTGRFIAYTFLCLGILCAIAMIICMLMNPDGKQKTINLLDQFYSGLKDGISKAFKQGTLKGIMSVLLAPFKAIAGTFKVMSQTTVGRLLIIALVFLFLAGVLFYGQYLKLNPKNNDAN